jgi:hypothetical protein
MHDTKILVQNLCDRGQAVGRTRGIGDDLMLFGIIVALVNPHAKRRIHPLAGRAEDDFSRTGTSDEPLPCRAK